MTRTKYIAAAKAEVTQKLTILALNIAHDHGYVRDFESIRDTVRRRNLRKRKGDPRFAGEHENEELEHRGVVDGMPFAFHMYIDCPDTIFLRAAIAIEEDGYEICIFDCFRRFEDRPYRIRIGDAVNRKCKNATVLAINDRLKRVDPELYDVEFY